MWAGPLGIKQLIRVKSYAMTGKIRGLFSGVKAELPQLGTAGSRSARLHAEDTGAAEPEGPAEAAADLAERAEPAPPSPRPSLRTLAVDWHAVWLAGVAGLLDALGGGGWGHGQPTPAKIFGIESSCM